VLAVFNQLVKLNAEAFSVIVPAAWFSMCSQRTDISLPDSSRVLRLTNSVSLALRIAISACPVPSAELLAYVASATTRIRRVVGIV
jgi:hypothetical protein